MFKPFGDINFKKYLIIFSLRFKIISNLLKGFSFMENDWNHVLCNFKIFVCITTSIRNNTNNNFHNRKNDYNLEIIYKCYNKFKIHNFSLRSYKYKL